MDCSTWAVQQLLLLSFTMRWGPYILVHCVVVNIRFLLHTYERSWKWCSSVREHLLLSTLIFASLLIRVYFPQLGTDLHPLSLSTCMRGGMVKNGNQFGSQVLPRTLSPEIFLGRHRRYRCQLSDHCCALLVLPQHQAHVVYTGLLICRLYKIMN